jgi:hypothetical protein
MRKFMFQHIFKTKMRFPDELLNLDYLVFSSHKSGTQTIVHSLVKAGFKSRHCHLPENIGLANGQFKSFVNSYYPKNHIKLSIISVFRDPLERHISSFFQWYGTRPLLRNEAQQPEETIIFQKSLSDLQKQFIHELETHTLNGREDSLDILCKELHLKTHRLKFDTNQKTGIVEGRKFRIYLLRFDLLFGDFNGILENITGKPIQLINQNISAEKWYAEKYRVFKKTLLLPDDIIEKVYHQKQVLMDVFYPGEYRLVVRKAKEKYGVKNV